jgi:hypothetical protein
MVVILSAAKKIFSVYRFIPWRKLHCFCVEPIGIMLLSLDGSIVFFFFFGGPLSKKQINE